MKDAEELLRAALLKLPTGLVEHVLRVVDEAERLAAIHGVDRDAARIAALGHDILRAHSDQRLLRIAADQGYELDASERMEPVLLHGPLAVPILRERYGVVDRDVLAAVAGHTTARAGMTPLEQVLFLADKIEPEKRARAGAIDRVADLAETDLDAAVLAYLDYHILIALDRRWPLHPNTIAARTELLARSTALLHEKSSRQAVEREFPG